jgi:dsRNA-specific ribonuclease
MNKTEYEIIYDIKDYEKYILNDKNKWISKKNIESILENYGIYDYKIKNIDRIQLSFIHDSYLKTFVINDKNAKSLKEIQPISEDLIKKTMPLQPKSYESLEFLGDAVIHNILAKYLFVRYYEMGNKDQGFLTRLRTKIEKGDTLGTLARTIGLNKYIIISRNIEIQGGRVNNIKIMEDIFEAFIGALSLEAPHEVCETFLINIIDKELDFAELINTEDNYKEMIMQYFHKIGLKNEVGEKYTPKYIHVKTIDDPTRKKFQMGVQDNKGKIVGLGIGISKKAGEQQAAYNALVKYKALKMFTEIQDNKSEKEDYYSTDVINMDEIQNKNKNNNDDDSDSSSIYGYID